MLAVTYVVIDMIVLDVRCGSCLRHKRARRGVSGEEDFGVMRSFVV
jgi:hypothetical protein